MFEVGEKVFLDHVAASQHIIRLAEIEAIDDENGNAQVKMIIGISDQKILGNSVTIRLHNLYKLTEFRRRLSLQCIFDYGNVLIKDLPNKG